MTDVVEIAHERRGALAAGIDRSAAEIGRLDDFLRMAEELVENSQSKSNKASDTEDEMAAGGNGADAEHEDLSVRELKAGERVDNSRTILNEPSPDRPRGLGLFLQKAT